MLDGTYAVKLKTPMGVKKGDVELHAEGNELTGKLIIMGKENPFTSGEADGDNFRFCGEMTTAVGKVAFDCSGQVLGDAIEGTVITKKGNLIMSGTRK